MTAVINTCTRIVSVFVLCSFLALPVVTSAPEPEELHVGIIWSDPGLEVVIHPHADIRSLLLRGGGGAFFEVCMGTMGSMGIMN